MKAFKKWLTQQLAELDKLHDLWLDLDEPWNTVQCIVQEAADRAAKLGLLEVCRKSREIKQGNIQEARWFIGECLRAIEAGKPKSGMLTVREAADQWNISQRTIYDLIECGRLRCQRIGKGRGTIRIKPTDLDRCVIEPTAKTYKHLTI
jgi:excisionase family DNA binding protein